MMNPNICKRVDIAMLTINTAVYQGRTLDIIWYEKPNIKRKRLYLKFSICAGDRYYLTDRS